MTTFFYAAYSNSLLLPKALYKPTLPYLALSAIINFIRFIRYVAPKTIGRYGKSNHA